MLFGEPISLFCFHHKNLAEGSLCTINIEVINMGGEFVPFFIPGIKDKMRVHILDN